MFRLWGRTYYKGEGDRTTMVVLKDFPSVPEKNLLFPV